jgi:hypothetical protein
MASPSQQRPADHDQERRQAQLEELRRTRQALRDGQPAVGGRSPSSSPTPSRRSPLSSTSSGSMGGTATMRERSFGGGQEKTSKGQTQASSRQQPHGAAGSGSSAPSWLGGGVTAPLSEVLGSSRDLGHSGTSASRGARGAAGPAMTTSTGKLSPTLRRGGGPSVASTRGQPSAWGSDDGNGSVGSVTIPMGDVLATSSASSWATSTSRLLDRGSSGSGGGASSAALMSAAHNGQSSSSPDDVWECDVVTGDDDHAGTKAGITLDVYGENGCATDVRLATPMHHEKFAKGTTVKLQLRLANDNLGACFFFLFQRAFLFFSHSLTRTHFSASTLSAVPRRTCCAPARQLPPPRPRGFRCYKSLLEFTPNTSRATVTIATTVVLNQGACMHRHSHALLCSRICSCASIVLLAGRLYKIRVTSDLTGTGSDWLLSRIVLTHSGPNVIRDPAVDSDKNNSSAQVHTRTTTMAAMPMTQGIDPETYTFEFNAWLNKRAPIREAPARGPYVDPARLPKLMTYTVKTFTGAGAHKRGVGTDANVHVQVCYRECATHSHEVC